MPVDIDLKSFRLTDSFYEYTLNLDRFSRQSCFTPPFAAVVVAASTSVPSPFASHSFFGVNLMLLFDATRLPAQFLKPSIFERAKARPQIKDAAQSESRERFVSVVLLLCVLAAGVYGEILRYAF
jgi:hypothetical protein